MSKMKVDKHTLAEAFCSIAERAGHEILSVYHGNFEVRSKADASPVTDADERAEQLILESLSRIVPDIPVVAEESVAAGHIPNIGGGPFLLVDPLDGTKEFVSRNGEFTVNIALIENGIPVLGVVHLPVLDETYWTNGDGEAWRDRGGEHARIHCRTPGDALWAAEQALQSGAITLLIVPGTRFDLSGLRRLQLAAEDNMSFATIFVAVPTKKSFLASVDVPR